MAALLDSFQPTPGVSLEAKLRELLRNLCSVEVEIYSEASKHFVKLLRGDSGGDLLRIYVESSPRCAELLEAWRMRVQKPGMVHIFSLVTAVLNHPFGKSAGGAVVRSLDAFARSIVTQRLDDVYVELNCEEFRRQNAALRLVAAVVRRGMGLASEVAKIFDFKLPVLSRLSGVRRKKGGRDVKKHKGRNPSRNAFIEFAMSFLEVGNPRLLRWILQQRDMYSSVLRGIGNDDDDTMILVLSVLRDKVLVAESMLPPGLRSVLFGSVTLEQLINISGNLTGGAAADLAHEVLVMVCRDPSNGLMPDGKLKGNPARLVDLMKKLKATDIGNHRELLLAIVKGRPSLCSSYIDVFPYSLEPSSSPHWFSAISLAADLISSSNLKDAFNSLVGSESLDPPNLDSQEMRCILRCTVPRFFPRSMSNKGLLHSDILVKHGSLRLVLEIFKSLDNLFAAIGDILGKISLKQSIEVAEKVSIDISFPGQASIAAANSYLQSKEFDDPNLIESAVQKWILLKEQIQDEVRSVLPDPQVLLKLLSAASFKSSGNSVFGLKRCQQLPNDTRKRLKSSTSSADDIEIVITGVHSEPNLHKLEGISDDEKPVEMDMESYVMTMIAEIWSFPKHDLASNGTEHVDALFHTKLLDVLTFYMRILPTSIAGTFDFFKALPSETSSLEPCQKQSLLSLLVEYAGGNDSVEAPEMMYKHLQPLCNMMILSEDVIRQQAYLLSRLAMLSTGAFDQNISEIDAWFLFLPGYKDKFVVKNQPQLHRELATVIIAFLCDAVSTIGNNLYRYLEQMHTSLSELKGLKDYSPSFGPFIICILQKCLRLLLSETGTFRTSEKTIISLYVSNTISFLLQTQINMGMLAGLVDLLLTQNLGDFCSPGSRRKSLCEWRPLKNLLVLSRNILHQKVCNSLMSFSERHMDRSKSSVCTILDNVREIMETEDGSVLDGVAISFSSAVICASPDDIIGNFPLLVALAQHLFGAHPGCLSSVLFLEWDFLSSVSHQCPDIFFSGFEIVKRMTGDNNCYDSSPQFPTWREFVASAKCRYFTDGIDLNEGGAVAFGLFLKHLPFYYVFAPVMNFISCNESASSDMLNFLEAKILEGVDDSMVSLRLVLFWAYQIRSSYITRPTETLNKLFATCFALISCFLDHLLLLPSGEVCSEFRSREAPPRLNSIWEVAELIFLHPLSSHISSHSLILKEVKFDNLEDFLTLQKMSVHPMDQCILELMSRITDFVLTLGNHWNVVVPEKLIQLLRGIIKQSVVQFKRSYELCILGKEISSFLPCFSVFNALMHFQSPIVLLELGHWMLLQIDDSLNGWISPRISALPLALYVSSRAFDSVCMALKQGKNKMHAVLWEDIIVEDFLPQSLYLKIFDFALRFNLEIADLCLLKAVSAAHVQQTRQTSSSVLSLSILLSRMVSLTPLRMLENCIHNMNKTKSRLLLKIIEVSTLHLDLFGMTFLSLLGKDKVVANASFSRLGKIAKENNAGFSLLGEHVRENSDCVHSKESFILMIPAALLFFTSNMHKFGQDNLILGFIPQFYSKILLDGIANWKQFVSMDEFIEEYEGPMHHIEELRDAFNSTLLGKSFLMLHHHFISSQNSVRWKKHLKIFETLYTAVSEDELVDFDIIRVETQSYAELFNVVNRIIWKLSFTLLLLFPCDNIIQDLLVKSDKESEVICASKESEGNKHAKLKFLNILFCTLGKIVRNFPLDQTAHDEEGNVGWDRLLQFLETFILQTIFQMAKRIRSCLMELPSIPFLESFVKSSLLYRFEDPFTIKLLHDVLDLLQGVYSSGEVLELLFGHSKFASALLTHVPSRESSSLVHSGVFLQPVPSLFRVSNVSVPAHNDFNWKYTSDLSFKVVQSESCGDEFRIELIRLVRLLFNLTIQQQGKDSEFVCLYKKELVSLLLSGYGASVSQTDREIFSFIQEIESKSGSASSGFAEMDYLWGDSAVKLRREHASSKAASSDGLSDPQIVQEKSRYLFREYLSIDSKLCALTAVSICYDGSKNGAFIRLKELQKCDVDMDGKFLGPSNSCMIPYDPAFILRFSIHALSKGYIEPVEFARLGLLAVSLVSISSSEVDVRKLGYEFLGCFQESLAVQRSSKDALQLQLLLTWLQNGISEPWQRIPSMAAVFAAEASFVLLDTSQDHFHAISKLLIGSSKMDFKGIPLFNTFFPGSSNQFRAERLWILQLVHAGLNVNDDAHIILKNSIIELLLSFYASSLSDFEAKFLVLQIVGKAVKFHALARHLVEHCGLVSWLYSVLLESGVVACKCQKDYSLKQLCMVLEVTYNVISLRFISEWLQQNTLEMLSNISSYLYSMMVNHLSSLKRNVWMVNTIIEIITITLRISQKRKIYQPHFTLSLDGIFQLCRAFSRDFCRGEYNPTTSLWLNMLLMSSPPPAVVQMDKVKLLNVILWSASSAMQSHTGQLSFPMESSHQLLSSLEGQGRKDTISRLLRWTIASVILGFTFRSRLKADEFHEMKNKNLQDLLENIEMQENIQTCSQDDFNVNKALSITILYLLHLLGSDFNLSSSISALCLLLKDVCNMSDEEMAGNDRRTRMASLCSKIHCPPEANPSWRWSFYQPWKDLSCEPTPGELLEQDQACHSLLVMFLNTIDGKLSEVPVLSGEDLEPLFAWKRSLILGCD